MSRTTTRTISVPCGTLCVQRAGHWHCDKTGPPGFGQAQGLLGECTVRPPLYYNDLLGSHYILGSDDSEEDSRLIPYRVLGFYRFKVRVVHARVGPATATGL